MRALIPFLSTALPILASAASTEPKELTLHLEGELPARCESEITATSVGAGPSLMLTLWVRHSCNTKSKLQLQIDPAQFHPPTSFQAQYRGEQKEAQTQVTFYTDGPLDAVSPIVLNLPELSLTDAPSVLSSISVDVSPD